ncbi:hypothetical protein JXA12_00395 [Candidatus Woesearchaeota archaeon]|nr:hypothetical protein [Candidatus Woesearchaeota archaeon]
MQDQKENLEQLAQEELEEKDIVDMFINDKATLDDVFGTMPSTPSYFNTSVDDLVSKATKFKEEFYGEPDTVKTKRIKGSIPAFLEKIGIKYFGGNVEEVIKGKQGIITEGEQLYEQATKEYEGIKGDLDKYNADVIKQENYLKKIEDVKSKHDDAYLKFEKKEQQAQDLIQKVQQRMEEDSLSLQERKKLTYILNDLYRRKENIELRTDEVSYTMVALGGHISNLNGIVKANKTILNRVRSEMRATDFDLRYFDLVVKTMPTTAGLSMVLPQLQQMSGRLSEYMSKFHNRLMENINDIGEQGYQTRQFLDDNVINGMGESVSGLMDKIKYDRQTIRNAAKNTIFK